MTLVEAISEATARNEAALAQSLNTPKLEFDTGAAARLQSFGEFCRRHGVSALVARPSTVAAYALAEYKRGTSSDVILKTLEDIGALHLNAGHADPTASTACRLVLADTLDLDELLPRSWSKSEKLLFASLPIEIRAIFARRIELDNKAIRKAQNERDAARQELEQLKKEH